jgi:hypothetical protein
VVINFLCSGSDVDILVVKALVETIGRLEFNDLARSRPIDKFAEIFDICILIHTIIPTVHVHHLTMGLQIIRIEVGP